MEGIKSPLRRSPKRDEERLNLLHNPTDPISVKVDAATRPPPNPPAGDNAIWRGSSYDFLNDAVACSTATKTTGEQEDSSVEFDFPQQKAKPEEDADLESQTLSPVTESPNEYGKITPRGGITNTKLSFKQRTSSIQRRRPSTDRVTSSDDVIRCTSRSSSFQRKSAILAGRTKSRLLDPPEFPDGGDRRSKQRSGLLSADPDEEDPFLDDDFPEEFKKIRYSFFSLVQLLSLILIVAAVVCSIAIPFLRGKTIWGMPLWKWGVMLLVLVCGGLVSGWLIRIVVFFIERNFLLRKRVLYFVYGLRSAVQNCLWLAWVLIAWNIILDQKVEKKTHSKYLSYVTKILVCFLVGGIIWLFKTVLVKVLAMSFHVSAFFDRIHDALFNQYVIETLSGPPLVEMQRVHEEEERVMCEVQKLQDAGAAVPADLRANCLPNGNGRPMGSARSTASGILKSPMIGRTPRSGATTIGKSPRFSMGLASGKEVEDEAGITIDHLHRLNPKNISAWNMKRLMNMVRKGVLSTLDEQLLDDDVDEASLQIRSEKQAKSAAKRIFSNVARPGSKFISVEDLERFMRDDEAQKTMHLFEVSTDSKGISKRALKNWVVNVFRERRALALSLNDTKTAVNKLHHLLNVLVGIGIVVIWLLIIGVPITHFLVFVSSQLLLLTFMFGNTFKTTFEAIIFLFVMHPFDVGDRCEIEGVQMVVEEMNILTTVFLRYDNQKIIYPNSILATKQIANYYRSPDMGDAIDFCVHISTPVEKISTMKERITRYIENKKEHWYPAPMIVMRDVEDMNRLKFSIWLSHTMNHQDMGERWARRALLVEEMVKVFRDLDIEYRMLPMDVNVRTLPSLVSERLPSNWITCGR